jgi:membrane fusion protein, heavy metal efflux system
MNLLVNLTLVLLVLTTGCSKTDDHAVRPSERPSAKEAPRGNQDAAKIAVNGHTPHADDLEKHDELPNRVRLPPEVVRAAGIKTAPAAVDSLPATVDLTGEIAADPDRSAQLAARVPGRIVDVRIKEGDRVKTGQIVAILDSPEIARARAVLAAVAARSKSAQLNADRLKILESKSLASGQEVAVAEAEGAALAADFAAARQTLAALGQPAEQSEGRGARVTIRAPLGGFVLGRDAVRGQSVDAGHIIAVIGDLDQVYFLGRLFEKDLARVKVAAAAEVRLNAYPNEVFEGKIETIGRQIDPAARTITARILVRNHGDLVKVGLFGTARVVIGPVEDQARRVVVPIAAVTRIANKDAAFVRQSDGDFDLHPVVMGRSAGGKIEILSGLRAGEEIVVEGVFTLKSAILKRTFGEED